MSVKTADIVVAVILLGLGLVLGLDSIRMGAGWGMDGPKAGFFPLIMALLVIAGWFVRVEEDVHFVDAGPEGDLVGEGRSAFCRAGRDDASPHRSHPSYRHDSPDGGHRVVPSRHGLSGVLHPVGRGVPLADRTPGQHSHPVRLLLGVREDFPHSYADGMVRRADPSVLRGKESSDDGYHVQSPHGRRRGGP